MLHMARLLNGKIGNQTPIRWEGGMDTMYIYGMQK